MTFNLREYMNKFAAKGKEDAALTEKTLRGGKDSKEPEVVSEKQLDAERKAETEPATMEKRLEKVRKEAHIEAKLPEARLDESKSKLAVHRNSSAYEGNIPKLEEKRLANKPVEKEKYEPASVYDKKMMWPVMTGKDGIRTASADFKINWVKGAAFEDLDFGETPFMDVEAPTEHLDPDLQDLIDEATKGVDVTGVPPLEDVSGNLGEDEDEDKFDYMGKQELDTGSTKGGFKTFQHTISFDPNDFRNKEQAEHQAAVWIASRFDRTVARIEDMMFVDFDNGIATVNLEESRGDKKPRRKAPVSIPAPETASVAAPVPAPAVA